MEQLTLDRATHNLLDRLNDNIARLADELERFNDQAENDTMEYPTTNEDGLYVCSSCGETFKSLSSFAYHDCGDDDG